jgi:hypothetical protein
MICYAAKGTLPGDTRPYSRPIMITRIRREFVQQPSSCCLSHRGSAQRRKRADVPDNTHSTRSRGEEKVAALAADLLTEMQTLTRRDPRPGRRNPRSGGVRGAHEARNHPQIALSPVGVIPAAPAMCPSWWPASPGSPHPVAQR